MLLLWGVWCVAGSWGGGKKNRKKTNEKGDNMVSIIPIQPRSVIAIMRTKMVRALAKRIMSSCGHISNQLQRWICEMPADRDGVSQQRRAAQCKRGWDGNRCVEARMASNKRKYDDKAQREHMMNGEHGHDRWRDGWQISNSRQAPWMWVLLC